MLTCVNEAMFSVTRSAVENNENITFLRCEVRIVRKKKTEWLVRSNKTKIGTVPSTWKMLVRRMAHVYKDAPDLSMAFSGTPRGAMMMSSCCCFFFSFPHAPRGQNRVVDYIREPLRYGRGVCNLQDTTGRSHWLSRQHWRPECQCRYFLVTFLAEMWKRVPWVEFGCW